ncbi:MAG: hypothetical protein GXO79_09715 [Chlorobi bacterium]|nr:hypothetical protein [Chlorobiota bacterium]
MEIYISYIITGLSLITALVAWIAKLKWSQEFSKAKEEIIKSKVAEIDFLKSKINYLEKFNPDSYGKFFDRIRKDLEETIDFLEKKNDDYKTQIRTLEGKLKKYRLDKEEIKKTRYELDKILNEYRKFKEKSENEIQSFKNIQRNFEKNIARYDKLEFEPSAFDDGPYSNPNLDIHKE